MDQELTKAIKIVEDWGGFVMLPENESEERDIRKVTHALEIQKEAEEQAEIESNKSNYESRKKDAFKEFDHALGSKNFSFDMVDDICYENGIDLDDIEEYIHSHY